MSSPIVIATPLERAISRAYLEGLAEALRCMVHTEDDTLAWLADSPDRFETAWTDLRGKLERRHDARPPDEVFARAQQAHDWLLTVAESKPTEAPKADLWKRITRHENDVLCAQLYAKLSGRALGRAAGWKQKAQAAASVDLAVAFMGLASAAEATHREDRQAAYHWAELAWQNRPDPEESPCPA